MLFPAPRVKLGDVLRLMPAIAVLLAAVPLAAGSPNAVPLERCTLDGGVSALCGTFTVPEDRSRLSGRTLSLRVAVIPARDGVKKADPLVHIAGGPGGSAVADALWVLSTFSDVNAGRDVVLVDQRGSGGSNPLECPAPRRVLTTAAAVRAYMSSCMSGIDADPRQYTTVPAMDDLADVLRALGYGQVNVYGGSYGATAAQYLLGQHPELVRTVIMDGATLLDVPIFELWARNGDRALRAILGRCAGTPACARRYPRVRREAFELIAALRRKPVRSTGVRIDAATAAFALQSLSRTPAGAARIPRLAHRARLGDWTPLARELRGMPRGAPRQIMYWSMVCNEPWARRNPGRTAAAGRGTYLAELTAVEARLAEAACSAVPKSPQPSWSASRVRSDKPVLFVVGGADPQDPLANIAGASRELPASRTIVLPGGGHGSVQLGCVPRLAHAFIERGTAAGLDARCAARYRPPAFALR